MFDGGPKAGCDARSGGPLLTGRDMRTDADEIHYAQNQVCSVVRAPAKRALWLSVTSHVLCWIWNPVTQPRRMANWRTRQSRTGDDNNNNNDDDDDDDNNNNNRATECRQPRKQPEQLNP